MSKTSNIRGYMTRVVQFFLGLDGILHGLEVISAYREQAWMTFILTSFHACIFCWLFILWGMTIHTIPLRNKFKIIAKHGKLSQ